MKRKFHAWSNGDASVGDSGFSYAVSFEIEHFNEEEFDEDNQKYLKEEIDQTIIQLLRKLEDHLSDSRLHIMTEDEYKEICNGEED